MIGILAGIVAVGGKAVAGGLLELELGSVGRSQEILDWIEVQGTRNRQSHDKVRRSDEGVGGRVGIVTSSEVTVVRRDDGVGLALLDILSVLKMKSQYGSYNGEGVNGGKGMKWM